MLNRVFVLLKNRSMICGTKLNGQWGKIFEMNKYIISSIYIKIIHKN